MAWFILQIGARLGGRSPSSAAWPGRFMAGIEVVSVSGETQERAARMRDDWGLERVRLAYGLSEAQMRAAVRLSRDQ